MHSLYILHLLTHYRAFHIAPLCSNYEVYPGKVWHIYDCINCTRKICCSYLLTIMKFCKMDFKYREFIDLTISVLTRT